MADERSRVERAYGMACLSAFKAFIVIVIGAVLIYTTIRSPASVFQPDAPAVRKYGLPRMILVTQAVGALIVLVGAAWIRSTVRAARQLLARIRELREAARTAS